MEQAAPEARHALDEVEHQRHRIAARIRVPAWYAVAYATAMMVAFVSPALVGENAGGSMLLLVTAAIIVLGLLDAMVRRSSQARVPIHDALTYPSARRPLVAMGVAIVVGSAITWLALANVSRGVSLVCGVVSAVAVVSTRAWALAAVRGDIRDGASR